MASNNVIVLDGAPRGKFEEAECTVAMTPGTVAQIDESEGLNANGRFSIEKFAAGSGGLGATVIVVEPTVHDPNAVVTTDYAINTNARIYWPQNGDDINMKAGGTITFGQKLIVETATGEVLAATGTGEDVTPFQALEAGSAGDLVHCKYIGQGGSIA